MSHQVRNRCVARAAMLVGVCVLSPSGAWAGQLQPPMGPVTPTMKSLEEIEPRVCINKLPGDSTAVHVISAPGRYYLTGDITGEPGKHGIDVRLVDGPSDRVSIDLNGFTLHGVPGSLDGIRAVAIPGGLIEEISIRPSRIELSAIENWDGNGVLIDGAAAVRMSNLSVSGCGGDGVQVRARCTGEADVPIEFDFLVSAGNGGNGVHVVNTADTAGVFCSAKMDFADLTTCQNGLDGLRIEKGDVVRLARVRSTRNDGDGLNALGTARGANEGFFDIVGCVFSDNLGHGSNVRASTNVIGETIDNKDYWASTFACRNGGDGFHLENMVGSRFERCLAASNGGSGISATTTTTGGAHEGFIDIAFSNFTNNLAYGVRVQAPPPSPTGGGGDKFVASNSASCNNGLDGFSLIDISGVTITDCLAGRNGGAGIAAVTPSVDGTYRWQLRVVDSVANDLQGIVVLCNAGETTLDIAECSALGNGGNGIDVRADENSSCWIRVSQSSTNNNGGGAASTDPGYGIRVGGFAGGPGGGGAGGRIAIDYESSSSNGNFSDGFRFETGFQGTALASISNCRAITNGGSGIDIRPTGPSTTFDVAVNFEDVFCSSNNFDGIRTDMCSVDARDVRCSSNTGSGVRAISSTWLCEGSSLTSNLGSGFIATDAVRLGFVGVSFDNNTGDGLTSSSPVGLATGPVTIQRCSFTGNSGSGCSIADSVGGQVTECSLFSNGLVGVEVLSTGYVLTGNVTGGNPGGGVSAVVGNAVGPDAGSSTIAVDNNFANTRP